MNAKQKQQYISPDAVNIWIIEDNHHFKKTVRDLVNATPGLSCSHAFTSCEDALKAFVEESPPEVILLDIGLPGQNGIDAIVPIKELSPSTKIIILTMYDDSDKIFNALCNGASGYLLKDTMPDKIIAAIHEVLAGGVPMNIPIARRVLEIFAKLKPQKNDYNLTSREKEILQFVVGGLTKQQIADKIFLSFHTVNTHLKNIYSKLQVNTLSGAISKVYKENLL